MSSISQENFNKLIDLLKQSGLAKNVITDKKEIIKIIGEEGYKIFQQFSELARINKIEETEQFIKDVLNGKIEGKTYIELPEVINKLAEKVLGHPIKSHRIKADKIRHIRNEHGENGNKNTEDSIPLRNEDIALMPYIMAAPSWITEGSGKNGKQSIRYYKELSNGYVVVVEREVSPNNESMDSITMWAKKNHSTNSSRRAATEVAPHEYPAYNARISQNDIAKIRKGFEKPKINDEFFKDKDIRFLHTADTETYSFTDKNGNIYIDPEKINANTPFHEFGHLWLDYLKDTNSELLNEGKQLVFKSEYFRRVNDNPVYARLSLDDKLEEALAHAIGDNGAKMWKNGEIQDNKLIQWLKRAWEFIRKNILKITEKTANTNENKIDRFARNAVYELTSGQDLTANIPKKRGFKP